MKHGWAIDSAVSLEADSAAVSALCIMGSGFLVLDLTAGSRSSVMAVLVCLALWFAN
jgi:hypothetical protein